MLLVPGLLDESYNWPGRSTASSSSSVSGNSLSIIGASFGRGDADEGGGFIDGVGDMNRAAIGGRSSRDSKGESVR